MKHELVIDFIRDKFKSNDFIPLHYPVFTGNERKYVMEALDSTYVSSVGAYVDIVEKMMADISQTTKAVAVVNGTSGLQIALQLVGVKSGEEVLTQALTFVATANAIHYTGAEPVFLDVDYETMGLSPKAVVEFLEEFGEKRDDGTFNKKTGKRISACVPMHTFGFPVHLDALMDICVEWNIPVVEDAAESLGSYYKGKHTGSFGSLGVFSFNGNKIVTCGGGGMIVTQNEKVGKLGKHLTTTAKVPHPYEYVHDYVGYNFRMPNLNAALVCAQLEQLNDFLANKRALAHDYAEFFAGQNVIFRKEIENTQANYWLMCIELENLEERNAFLKATNDAKTMTRPIWQLMYRSPMYQHCYRDDQKNAEFLEERIVNIPSSVRN
jgi:aminotransferase in exopolysaccharide biosynthesis